MRTSCGVFVIKAGAAPSFLLLQDGGRWDLPKGKQERDESELECAVRELFEETRLGVDALSLDPTFRWSRVVRGRRGAKKRLVMFLAVVDEDAAVRCDEHDGHAWVTWPARRLGAPTIDALVRAVDAHLAA